MVTWWGVPIIIHYFFVPYNLFKLFLVHKISVNEYIYIYENRKKKWKKEKEKGFSASWAGGRFWPSRARACARARAGGPLGPPVGERCGDGVVGVGPRARGRGLTAWSGDGGANRSGLDHW
jgi:hypothetical protein